MTDSESTNLSKRVIVTEDGVVRYYWKEIWAALTWVTLGLGLVILMSFVPLPLACSLLYFLFPGLGLLYFGIGKAINYTEFRVESGNLFVRHKPLLWWRNISIPTMEIGNIDVKQVDTIHYDSNDFGSTVTHRVNYQVVAVHLQDGHKIPLISVLSLDIADAIVREVGNALGIIEAAKTAPPPLKSAT